VNTPVTVNISGPDSVCLGQTTQLIASGAAIYSWTPAQGLNNPNIANPKATPDASQAGSNNSAVINYQVTGYDSKKCFSDTKSVDITVFNYPVINLVPNATINVGTTYQINATTVGNIVSLDWVPSNTLSCSNCLTPVAKPTITTKYLLTAVNDGGCAKTDSIRIQVICNGANFFVPNSFSPNGDGVNDHFIINGIGLNVIPSITIYNRWGQIVFQKSNFPANSPADAWDGTFNGQPAPADVYIYTIQILCDNATLIPYHGNVTLIR
jgi:gliding motility-associated-like protein